MKLQPHGWEFGHRSGGETFDRIDADAKIRPLRDMLIVQPLDVNYSRHILVERRHKPLRGRVLAAGPGHYPHRYDHVEKHKRTKMWSSKCFLPCDVRVGDVVELGGEEIGGYAFTTFWWGEKLCLIASERDVCGIVPDA